jgi:site-specific DNA-cytosine methylase
MVAGTRSGLAYSFLALAERHRPRFVLLENVPGLLSSHGGRDMAALIGALVELGYGVGYRVLDARYFGVPQRRRRVFILGDSLGGRAGAERAAEVLSVGSRCRRHPPTGIEAGPGVAAGAQPGVDITRAVTGTSGKRHDDDTDTLIANGLRASDGHHGYGSPRGDGGDNLIAGTLRVGGRAQGAGSSYDNTPITVAGPIRSHLRPGSNSLTGIVRETPDPGRMRAPDGLAGRSHDRAVVNALDQQRGGADDNAAQAGHLVTAYHKATKAHEADGLERWEPADVSDTLDANAMGAVAGSAIIGGAPAERDMLPLGLDSHRYRCCGNGGVSDVSEWIGLRLAEVARAIA